MIDVQSVLNKIPHFDTFCSVDKLHRQVDSLRGDPRFQVSDVGTSVNGVPIHHVRFGQGSVRALFIGFPHCMEAIAGLTISSLITLLQQEHAELTKQDIEWHFVPCIDPDGALLNEGWSQKPLTFESYMRNFHQQPLADQVDATFPVDLGTWTWDSPSQEARVLMGVLDRIRPDFYYSGHDSRLMTGSFYYVKKDIDPHYYEELSALLRNCRMPFAVCVELLRMPRVGDGVYRSNPILQPVNATGADSPPSRRILAGVGGNSYNYLASINPDALMLTGELSYIRYVGDDLSAPSGETRRKILLGVSASNKLVAAAILDEWDAVKNDLDTTSPFYRKIHTELIERLDEIPDGLLHWYDTPISRLVCDPIYAQVASRGEFLDAMIGAAWGRFGFLCQAYEFVRLLKASKQTPAVRDATARLDAVFDAALADIDRQVDLRRFEPVDCTTLAKAHLGGALIGLNSLLEKRDEEVAA